MHKQTMALVLCVTLLLGIALPVRAEETADPEEQVLTVRTEEQLLELAESCRLDSFSLGLTVSLEADLDLNGLEFAGFPIFCGTFRGNGHTIRGIRITHDGSDQGFFRHLTQTAVVQQLHLEGSVEPGGTRSRTGGLAGNNAGQILQCSFSGTVTGSEYVGGIAGINGLTGLIEECTVSGSITGGHFAGGMAGENSGVVRRCENNAVINETALDNTIELTDVTLDAITDSEMAMTVTDIGGIAGISTGVIRSCVNRGHVGYPHMGYNVGGIAGTQSGALLDCENHGHIRGRKDVGGIVGQLEPTAMIEYAEDALQILQKQLSGMGNVVSNTVSSVRNTGDRIAYQVESLRDQVRNAQDAVESLVPTPENPELPDDDAIQAAQNAISTSISGMTDTLQSMSATAKSAIGTVSTNLYAMQDQLNAMRATLGNASETLGGSITDVSDLDTERDLTGKVSGCVNYGQVLADRNAGGIAGTVAMENDLDMDEDWTITGENSLNFESELRAVILSCTNEATVTCKKENGGGIAGLQAMGLIRRCINTGDVEADGADYVGGIAGQGLGYIRQCSTKCNLAGGRYIGGIAGCGTVVSDCRSMVHVTQAVQTVGAVLGSLETPWQETEKPVSGNLYVTVAEELGGIDGVSYHGQAQAVDREAFLALPGIPDRFGTVLVRFVFPDGREKTIPLALGASLEESAIPPVPDREGYMGYWEDLTAEAVTDVHFDRTFTAAYRAITTVITADAVRDGFPVMLAQGLFPDGAALTVTPVSETEVAAEGTLLEVWSYTLEGAEALEGLRIRLPEGCDAESVRLLRQSSEGWTPLESHINGSYLVTATDEAAGTLALVAQDSVNWLIIAAAAVLVLLGIGYLSKRRKPKPSET